jgi:hypothetical protein
MYSRRPTAPPKAPGTSPAIDGHSNMITLRELSNSKGDHMFGRGLQQRQAARPRKFGILRIALRTKTTVNTRVSQPRVVMSGEGWCPWPESNQHSLRNSILSRARLPVPPQGHSGCVGRKAAPPRSRRTIAGRGSGSTRGCDRVDLDSNRSRRYDRSNQLGSRW